MHDVCVITVTSNAKSQREIAGAPIEAGSKAACLDVPQALHSGTYGLLHGPIRSTLISKVVQRVH